MEKSLSVVERQIETREAIKTIVINVLNLSISNDAIDLDADLYELGVDSMSVIDLVLAFEDEFKIVLPEDELTAALFQRLGNIYSLLLEKQGLLAS